MTDQNVTSTPDTNTPPVTVQDTSWQQFAPNYSSPAEVAKALAETKASLTRTQQELAQFKNKPQETPKAEIPSWEFWDQPDKLYSLEQKRLTDEFRGTLEARGIPKPFIDDLEQTVFTAREVIAQQTQSKFDALAGFPDALPTLTKYITETYQGDAQARRLKALSHGDYWEAEATRTLMEMKQKDWKPTAASTEPEPLPTVSTQTSTLVPLDPNSKECRDLMTEEDYWTNPAKQKMVGDRILLYKKSQARR